VIASGKPLRIFQGLLILGPGHRREASGTKGVLTLHSWGGHTPVKANCIALSGLPVMPEQEMSGPESSNPLPSAAGLLRELPDDSKLETDLANLAARFSAQSGGGLPPELSADLALEIVLNEIVEQACLATGATGAAVVLERDGEMVCRASSGPTAPELGSRFDTTSGLSGECFKARRTQRCDDVLADTRVDIDASGRLGVRSLVVMPLLRGADLVGVIELFSARPYAFGVRDERTLEVLADRTLNNLEHASHPLDLCSESGAPSMAGDRPEETHPPGVDASPVHSQHVSEPEALAKDAGDGPRRRLLATRYLLSGFVVVGAVLIGLVLGRQWGTRAATSQPQPALSASGAGGTTTVQPASAVKAGNPNKGAEPNALAAAPTPAPTKPSRRVPPGGLLVLQNGAEVFRLLPNESPARDQEERTRRPSLPQSESAVETSAASAEGSLVYRVEPEYPEAARLQNIQGTVVLEVHIDTDGAVQEVRMGSGPPLLAQAASDAVKQWKFKPRLINGNPVEMQTRVTLNFRLPQ